MIADTDTFSYRSLQVGEAFGRSSPRRYPVESLAWGVGAGFRRAKVASMRLGMVWQCSRLRGENGPGLHPRYTKGAGP